LIDNAGAVDVKVDATDLEKIDALLLQFPDMGDRYNATFNQFVDKGA
jgi:hypothetical protein